MITPNKVVTLENSALGLVSVVLEEGPGPIDLIKLYHYVEKSFESIDQFLLAIDLLYVLGRIEIDFQTRSVLYAS
jgi:hypothetical protein